MASHLRRRRPRAAASRITAPAPAAPSPAAGAAGVLHTVAVAGSPIALASALMFYFGWIRVRAEAAALGYDVAVTDMSVRDFTMKSIVVLYVPLLIPVLAALVLVWAHHRLVARAARRPRTHAALLWCARVAVVSWPVWLTVCAGLMVFVPPVRWFAIPACLTLALASAAYGDRLRQRLITRERLPPAVRTLVVVALVLAVFWDTERLAGAVGTAYAARVRADPAQLVAVTVLSAKRLWISLPEVTETRLDPADSAYLFRYDGLRLLQRSGGRYFLISPVRADPRRQVLVLTDAPGLRFDFSR